MEKQLIKYNSLFYLIVFITFFICTLLQQSTKVYQKNSTLKQVISIQKQIDVITAVSDIDEIEEDFIIYFNYLHTSPFFKTNRCKEKQFVSKSRSLNENGSILYIKNRSLRI